MEKAVFQNTIKPHRETIHGIAPIFKSYTTPASWKNIAQSHTTTEYKLCIRPTKSIIRYFTLPLHLPRLTSINNENSSFSRSSTRSSFYTGWYTRPPSIHIQGHSTTRTVRTPCILIR
uniref:Uncharacterized protein n=1 Tax=Cacopsylla melanoneura TaxID=428564 RepID=A0A8D8R6J3_9HEMI